MFLHSILTLLCLDFSILRYYLLSFCCGHLSFAFLCCYSCTTLPALCIIYIYIYIYIYITVLIKSIFYMFWYYISWLYITVAYQAVQSLGFSRQECWSGLPFPSPGDLPPPRNRTQVSRIAGRRFTVWATREALYIMIQVEKPTILGISQIIKSWKARGA